MYIYRYYIYTDYIYTYIQADMHMCLHIHIYTCLFAFLYLYIHTYIYMHVYKHTYVHIYIHTPSHTCLCIYVYISIYTCTRVEQNHKHVYIDVHDIWHVLPRNAKCILFNDWRGCKHSMNPKRKQTPKQQWLAKNVCARTRWKRKNLRKKRKNTRKNAQESWQLGNPSFHDYGMVSARKNTIIHKNLSSTHSCARFVFSASPW